MSWAMVAHVFNPSTQEAEAGESLSVQGQLQSEPQDSQAKNQNQKLKKKKGVKNQIYFL